MTQKTKNDQLLGTLEMLVLRVLSLQELHGYGIARRIEQLSDGALTVQEGSLYPALHRLERKGFIQSEWKIGESKRRMKAYLLSSVGKEQLETELSNWDTVSRAVNTLLANTKA